MGYRVDYQPVRKIRGAEKRRSTVPALTALFFLVFLLLVNLYWEQGAQVLKNLVLREEMATALEVFSQELKAGEELKSAWAHFCGTLTGYGKMAGY